jgi:hypothetical protein
MRPIIDFAESLISLCARSDQLCWSRSCQLPEASLLAYYKNPAMLDSGSILTFDLFD